MFPVACLSSKPESCPQPPSSSTTCSPSSPGTRSSCSARGSEGFCWSNSRGRSPEQIADLHRTQTRLGYWAFWVLGLGIFLGAVWADRAWGRWWAFDPKETWALITWLAYLAMVHIPASRLSARRRPVIVATLHLLGLLAMLWTYFGVNLLLPSLHSYA
ncbi:MAG: cytochrome c biogenesis protein CcsA [Phycisphaerales bacterium]